MEFAVTPLLLTPFVPFRFPAAVAVGAGPPLELAARVVLALAWGCLTQL